MTLVEFILARLGEDEAAARRAKPGPWTQDGGSIYAGHPTEEVVDWVYDDSWEHIARHDPARVLADVAAKRRIVDEWRRATATRCARPHGFRACWPCRTPTIPTTARSGHREHIPGLVLAGPRDAGPA